MLEEDQIDWDLLGDIDVDPNSLPEIPSGVFSNDPSPLSVDDIEQLLMQDDDECPNWLNPGQDVSDGFFQDVLLDSPVEDERSGEVVDVSDGDHSAVEEQQKNEVAVGDQKVDKDTSDDASGDPNDPAVKKRKRQLRNKDAALRSRERKKMYVKDLEMKSRYYEGECKRLGSILQCFMAENQALRFSLHSSKAFDASVTKQESAVLLLESLLLGSLLWFLGMVCLLIHPILPQQSLGAAQPETVVEEKRQNLVLRKMGSKICGNLLFQSHLVGKRCKASRSRMKGSYPCLEVLGKALAAF